MTPPPLLRLSSSLYIIFLVVYIILLSLNFVVYKQTEFVLILDEWHIDKYMHQSLL